METILTELGSQQSFRIDETSCIGVVRRYASRLSDALGFNATLAGELAIVITEATTNILHHAGSGELLIRPLRSARGNGIEILAIDKGPGISDIVNSMRDGVSTTGTAGSGLGAMRRLAAEFSLYSFPGKGAVFYLTVWQNFQPWADRANNSGAGSFAPLQIGVVSLPMHGEDVCGDGWAVVGTERPVLVVADGLGHGPDAARAARAVIEVLNEHAAQSPARLMELAHQHAHATRGAAVAFAALEQSDATSKRQPSVPKAASGESDGVAPVAHGQQLQFAGVGNISASIQVDDQRRQQLISHNGIVGHNLRKIQQLTQPFAADALLIMHSDGLASQWDLAAYPGLVTRHPALIAAVLYRDFNRGTDDVTVLVTRCAPHLAA